MAQKIKRESWLVFYRTKSGKLSSIELDGNLSRKEALDKVCADKGFDHNAANADGRNCLEWGIHGPIIKRLQYV